MIECQVCSDYIIPGDTHSETCRICTNRLKEKKYRIRAESSGARKTVNRLRLVLFRARQGLELDG